ncbi:ABC transporter substrate-binding protein [Microbacterium betulae]|uniref:Thiamine pyrimidine synthase n=1 Tax=Microbacterium betulae TaxID=2981139 RepID=A0AA97FJ07_9MICO|nr:ABC transporter substrate-binding protein [Microbacterium sp. AB]WOF22432.1 ABC transporter substrate-binding protein [Microbacterium sp. AB]
MTIPGSARPRAAAALSALALSSLLLTACAGGGDTGSAEEAAPESFGDITVQLSWIKNEEFAGEYFADANGYYAEAGFDSVNLVPGPSTGVAELAGGTADIAINDSVSTGAAVANEGAPLKIIGTTLQKNPFTILSLADGGNILTPADLVGKTIGVQDSNRSLFDAFLVANGIDASDVEIVPVQYDPSPVANGEVDGFMAYLTNEAISVEMLGLATSNLPFADNGMPFVAETFTVTDETLQSDREMLKAFLVAEIRGWGDALADPDEGARLALEEYGADLDLDPEKTLAGMLATNELVVTEETEANGLFTISEELQAETVESLARAGIELEVSDLFDLSLLEEVYAENPDLREE